VKIYCPVDEKETNIKADGTCEQCDSDLTPLLRLKKMPRAYLEEALKLKNENRVEEAIERLIMAIYLNNGFWEAHYELGNLYTQKGLYEDAIAQLNKAMAIAPANDEIIKAKEKAEFLRSQVQESLDKQIRKLRIFNKLVIVASLAAFFIGLSINPISMHLKKQQPEPPKATLVQLAAQIAAFQYTVKSADCLELIAYKFYGNRQMWEKIYKANKGKIANPNILTVGQVLDVPIKYK
jgi:tetratricopeptide (TPR) repeat protein